VRPKDRMVAALEHQESDRVPVGELAADYEITERALGRWTYYRSKWREYYALWEGKRDEIVRSYTRDIVDLTRTFGWDFVGVPLVPAKNAHYEMPEFLAEYTWRDPAGRVMKYSPISEGHAMVIQNIDMSLGDIDMPTYPAEIDWSQLEVIEGVVKELRDTHFLIARVGGSSFPWEETVGMEEFLVRMITQPEFVRKAIEASTRQVVALARAAIELGCDAVSTGEDYCDNRGPIMGPRRFREFCLPSLRRVVRATHDVGGYFIKHSDGNHWAILDDFVEAGVDGWHGIQISIGMDFTSLKQKYGQDLCFFGGVDCETLVSGTPHDVQEQVLNTLRCAGKGGGLAIASSNTLMVGTRYENYLALLETVRQFGNYPLTLPLCE
jgi:hypothetical protein